MLKGGAAGITIRIWVPLKMRGLVAGSAIVSVCIATGSGPGGAIRKTCSWADEIEGLPMAMTLLSASSMPTWAALTSRVRAAAVEAALKFVYLRPLIVTARPAAKFVLTGIRTV